MTAALITIGFVSALAIFSLVALIIENGKRHSAEIQAVVDRASENMNLMFEQLAESRRNEAKSMQDVADIQATIIKDQQETINALHTRLTMEEAQASADLNEQYHGFQAPTFPQELVTTGSPNGHVPSGWSLPPDPMVEVFENIPEDVVPIPREDEPTDL